MFAVHYLLRDTLRNGLANLAGDTVSASRALDGLPPDMLSAGVNWLALAGAELGQRVVMSFPDAPPRGPMVAIVMNPAEEVDQTVGQGFRSPDPGTAGATYVTSFAGSFSCVAVANGTDEAIWLGMAVAWLLLAGRPALSLPAYGQQIYQQSLAIGGLAPASFNAGGSEGVFSTVVTFRCCTYAEYDEVDTAVDRLAVTETVSFTNPYQQLETDVLVTPPYTP